LYIVLETTLAALDVHALVRILLLISLPEEKNSGGGSRGKGCCINLEETGSRIPSI